MILTFRKSIQLALASFRPSHPITTLRAMTTTTMTSASNKKGFAFGLVKSLTSTTKSPTSFGGKVLAIQSVEQAAYKENMEGFTSAFVYEFPTMQNALDWYEAATPTKSEAAETNGEEEEDGPITVVLEGEDGQVGDYKGFSVFFIKVHDKEKFAKYNPKESLATYRTWRIASPVKKASLATTTANEFDMAVLIAFTLPEEGRAWLESEAYKKPHGDLRLAVTSGHGIVIGKPN